MAAGNCGVVRCCSHVSASTNGLIGISRLFKQTIKKTHVKHKQSAKTLKLWLSKTTMKCAQPSHIQPKNNGGIRDAHTHTHACQCAHITNVGPGSSSHPVPPLTRVSPLGAVLQLRRCCTALNSVHRPCRVKRGGLRGAQAFGCGSKISTQNGSGKWKQCQAHTHLNPIPNVYPCQIGNVLLCPTTPLALQVSNGFI